MKQNYNILIIGGVLLLALVAYSFYSNGDLSVIGGSDVIVFEQEGLTCDIPQDCYNSLISDFGFPKSELDAQLASGYELICDNSQCGVKSV